jgi:hypothetical protein
MLSVQRQFWIVLVLKQNSTLTLFFFFFFLWSWSLNSGLRAWKLDMLVLEPYLQAL